MVIHKCRRHSGNSRCVCTLPPPLAAFQSHSDTEAVPLALGEKDFPRERAVPTRVCWRLHSTKGTTPHGLSFTRQQGTTITHVSSGKHGLRAEHRFGAHCGADASMDWTDTLHPWWAGARPSQSTCTDCCVSSAARQSGTERQRGRAALCSFLRAIQVSRGDTPALTGACSKALASSFFMVLPSSGRRSIFPVWAKSKWVPGGRGITSGGTEGPW